jgi:hypothetical protein
MMVQCARRDLHSVRGASTETNQWSEALRLAKVGEHPLIAVGKKYA